MKTMIVGPAAEALGYARQQGWTEDEVEIACSVERVRMADPVYLDKILLVYANRLRRYDDLLYEIGDIRSLYPHVNVETVLD